MPANTCKCLTHKFKFELKAHVGGRCVNTLANMQKEKTNSMQ
jgi:hypothetical protein